MSQASESVGSSERPLDANMFTITGPITINYSSSSIAGVPTFSYQDAELQLNVRGEDITQEDGPLGEVVTVTLENVADAFVRTFTLLVPKVRLRMGDQISFDTLGVETIDRSVAFTPPPGPTGVLQIYRSHQLQGVAEAVIF